MKLALVGSVVSSTLNFRSSLIRLLASQGHDVFVLAVDYTPETEEMIRNLGAMPVSYRLARASTNPLEDIKSCMDLRRIFKRLGPDIVFAFFSKPVIYGALAAAMVGVPRRVGMLEGLGFTFTVPPSGIASRKQQLLRWVQVQLYRLAFHFLDRIIFLNPDDPVDLLEKYDIRTRDVKVLGGIGVDLTRFRVSSPPMTNMPADRQAASFLFVGRLLAEKGIHEYADAARLVKDKYPVTRFVVLGGLDEENPGGLSRTELDVLIADGIIDYPGFVTDVSTWMAQTDVFVLPSYYREGVPASTQEAMAVGRAVLTTDRPGCRETVENGVNGYLVPAGDANALADKMIHLIEHPDEVIRMGQASRQIAERQFDAVEMNKVLAGLVLLK